MVLGSGLGLGPTWAPKVGKMMAFRNRFRCLEPLVYVLFGVQAVSIVSARGSDGFQVEAPRTVPWKGCTLAVWGPLMSLLALQALVNPRNCVATQFQGVCLCSEIEAIPRGCHRWSFVRQETCAIRKGFLKESRYRKT